ncbi:MAG: hypothetical protein OCU22_00610 [Canidatus Methanoxibalbensis ujae]|nr:hypothetical protein [Candidatus Methanoxibalbensis ujae]
MRKWKESTMRRRRKGEVEKGSAGTTRGEMEFRRAEKQLDEKQGELKVKDRMSSA